MIIFFSENPPEDRLYVPQRMRQVQTLLDFPGFQMPENRAVFQEYRLKILLPPQRPEGRFLYQAIGFFPAQTLLHQPEHHALGEDQPARSFQIGLHRFRVDHQMIHQLGGAVQHVIEKDGAVRCNNPLYGGMADVSFMPERDIFQRRQGIGPHDPG